MSRHRRTWRMPSPAMKKKTSSRLSRSRSRQIQRLEIARPFGRSELISPQSDLADQSQPSISKPSAQINPVVCIARAFRSVRSSRSTRPVDLRSNGPHSPSFSLSPIQPIDPSHRSKIQRSTSLGLFGQSDLCPPRSDLANRSYPPTLNPTASVAPSSSDGLI